MRKVLGNVLVKCVVGAVLCGVLVSAAGFSQPVPPPKAHRGPNLLCSEVLQMAQSPNGGNPDYYYFQVTMYGKYNSSPFYFCGSIETVGDAYVPEGRSGGSSNDVCVSESDLYGHTYGYHCATAQNGGLHGTDTYVSTGWWSLYCPIIGAGDFNAPGGQISESTQCSS